MNKQTKLKTPNLKRLKLKAIKTLNVIQIIDSLAAGGAEMMAVNTANALIESGVSSHLCATRNEGPLKDRMDAKVGYVFLNKQHVLDSKAIHKLVRYCKKHKITHVHAHSSSYATAVLVKLFLPKIKIIWHNHYGNSRELSKKYILTLKLFSHFFSASISVNQNLFEWGKSMLKVKNQIFIQNFALSNPSNDGKINLYGEFGKRILCIANFRIEKDHLNLIEAFKLIHQNYPDWTLHLVGADDGDAYAQSIHNAIAQNNLNQKVFCYGTCLNTFSVLEQATIGVLSSKSEGLPVSLLEYGLHSLPVVVTDVGECAAVVETGLSGLVVPASNAHLLANAIETLIENKALREAFGKELSAKVASQYSKNTYISTLKALYTHV